MRKDELRNTSNTSLNKRSSRMNQDEPRDKKRKSRFYLMVLSDEAHVMNGAGKARDDVGWHPPTILSFS